MRNATFQIVNKASAVFTSTVSTTCVPLVRQGADHPLCDTRSVGFSALLISNDVQFDLLQHIGQGATPPQHSPSGCSGLDPNVLVLVVFGQADRSDLVGELDAINLQEGEVIIQIGPFPVILVDGYIAHLQHYLGGGTTRSWDK